MEKRMAMIPLGNLKRKRQLTATKVDGLANGPQPPTATPATLTQSFSSAC